MLFLSQRDPRWSQQKLGASPLTVGRYGCTTTAIAMASDRLGCYRSPLEIASEAKNYTPTGLVLWQNLKFDKMHFVRREYGRNDEAIKAALKNPEMQVLLEVNDKAHWVIANKKVGNDYEVTDPWTGKTCKVLAVYHNITGAAYWEEIGTVTSQPVIPVDPELGKRLAGTPLICPEERGRLYLVNTEGKKVDLGGDAFAVQAKIAKLATGISKADLAKIPNA